jgi:hypothetical protein
MGVLSQDGRWVATTPVLAGFRGHEGMAVTFTTVEFQRSEMAGERHCASAPAVIWPIYLAIDFSAACNGAAPGLLTLFLMRMSTGDAGLP